MRKTRLTPLLALLVLLAPAVVPAAEQTGTGLTIYSSDLALVRQHVDRILAPGQSTVRIDGLPTSFDPGSLMVLDPEVVLLGAHGMRSYQGTDGPGASIDLDLDVVADVDGLDIAYLAGGFGWQASYNLLVSDDDTRGRIDGYAEIQNHSGASFEGARIQLLAGQINRGGGERRSYEMADMAMMRMAASAPAPELSEQGFAGYHLYDVSTPLDLASGESRRIRMNGGSGLSLQRVLRAIGDVNVHERQVDPERRPVLARYVVARPAGQPFADVPLPGGQVRVMQPDPQGRVQLLGIASIGNTPAGEELVLPVGVDFDVIVKRQQTDFTRVSRDVVETSWKVQVRNGSKRAVALELIERVPGDWQILSTSRQPDATTARTARFDLQVEAGGEVTIEYRLRVQN